MYLTIDNEAKKVESSPKKIGRNCPPPNALWVSGWIGNSPASNEYATGVLIPSISYPIKSCGFHSPSIDIMQMHNPTIFFFSAEEKV